MIDPSILLSDLINKPESHSSYCPLERFPSKVAPSQDGTLPTISWLRFHQPSPVADRSPPPHPPSPGPIKPPTDENQSESYLYHLFMFWRKSDGWDGVKLTNGGRAIMRLVLTILKSTSISINIHNNDRQTFIGLTFSNRSLHRSIDYRMKIRFDRIGVPKKYHNLHHPPI